MKLLLLFLLTFQVADADGWNDPTEPKIDFKSHWVKEFEKGEEFTYPPLDFRFPKDGNAGWAKGGTFGNEFYYVKDLGDGKHLIELSKSKYFSPLAGSAISKGSAEDVAARNGSDKIYIGQKTRLIVVKGKMPKYQPGERLPFNHNLLILGLERLPGIGETLRLDIVDFPPLPRSRAEIGIDVRKWTDQTGKFTTDAAFETYKEGSVTLSKPDGTEIKVPMATLSPKDQRFVRDALIAEKQRKDEEERKQRSDGK